MLRNGKPGVLDRDQALRATRRLRKGGVLQTAKPGQPANVPSGEAAALLRWEDEGGSPRPSGTVAATWKRGA